MHEHPHSASSWNMDEVMTMMLRSDVGSVDFDMCAFGMTSRDELGEGKAQKRTRVMSNAPEVLKVGQAMFQQEQDPRGRCA